jgi:trans-aconitate methyltransferase
VHTLLEHAGDGDGRLALDLGSGVGVETALLLDRGWRVLAVDGDREAMDSLRARFPTERLVTATRAFADLDELPELSLVHAAWSLPYAGRHLPRLWDRLLAALVPGGWLGCDLFGERDTTADADDIARLTDDEIARYLGPFDVAQHDVEEADGTAYSGPQHWHVHSVVARRLPD